jgi:hypothetical protein
MDVPEAEEDVGLIQEPLLVRSFTVGGLRFRVDEVISSDSSRPSITFTTPEGWKVLNGGVEATGNILLTASYPQDERTWVASYKAHIEPSSGQITLRVISVQLANGASIPSSDYLVSRVRSGTTSPLRTSASVSSGFTLVGGGAQALYNGAGVLLTGSYPSGPAWLAEAKAHHIADTGTVTAYVIGLRSTLLNGNRVRVETKLCVSNDALSPSVVCSVAAPRKVIGGGARAQWEPGYGQLLIKSTTPSESAWAVAAKAHVVADTGTVLSIPISVQPL